MPCLIAALAVQRLIEGVDLVVRQVKTSDQWPAKKTIYLCVIFILTLVAVRLNQDTLSVFKAVTGQALPYFDTIVSALVISGGTETINELLKLIGYKKEEAKRDVKTAAGGGAPPPAPHAQKS
jgi:hypothetical protein